MEHRRRQQQEGTTRLRLQPLHQRQYQYRLRLHLPRHHRLLSTKKTPLVTSCNQQRPSRPLLQLQPLSMIHLLPRKFRLFLLRNVSCNHMHRVGSSMISNNPALPRTPGHWYPQLRPQLGIRMLDKLHDEPRPAPLHSQRRNWSKRGDMPCLELAFGPLL
jgi:hypothetical protein